VAAPCPRCSTPDDEAPLSPGAGALGEAVCGRCGGRLLEEAAVQEGGKLGYKMRDCSKEQ